LREGTGWLARAKYIRREEAEQLIPKINAVKELNEYETLNILEAQRWRSASAS
jgi:hypothetical protein